MGLNIDRASAVTKHTIGLGNVTNNPQYYPGGTDVAIEDGGTGQNTAQLAIDALTNVAGATNEHVLTKDTTTGNALFKVASSVVPGGSNTQVQFNNSGAFSGDSGMTYEKITNILTVDNLNLPTTTSSRGILKYNENSFLHTYGTDNVFIGQSSGNFTTSGSGQNFALGTSTLNANTTGYNNVAIGKNALSSNSAGYNNTAVGNFSLDTNTVGDFNSAVGVNALYSNTIGNCNSAFGVSSLFASISGDNNSAFGFESLYANISGHTNSGVGFKSLRANTTGFWNSSVGVSSLFSNTSGGYNSAFGVNALYSNTSGDFNSAFGVNALYSNNGANNSALGFRAGLGLTTGSNNVFIGYKAGDTSQVGTVENSIALGKEAFTTLSNQIVIGNNSITQTLLKGNVGIGVTTSNAVLHLKAGTVTANTAPLKFTSGTNLTTPEAGAIEYDGTNLFFTPSTTRNKLDTLDNQITVVIENNLIVYGGGSVITTGEKSWVRVPKTCTIVGWELTADQSGSVVIDIWKDTFANYPPTSGDTIIGGGGTKPTLSSQIKNSDSTLTNWTTSLTVGDYLKFNIDSVSTVTKIVLVLKYS